MHYQNKIFVPLRPKNEGGEISYDRLKPRAERTRSKNEKAQQQVK